MTGEYDSERNGTPDKKCGFNHMTTEEVIRNSKIRRILEPEHSQMSEDELDRFRKNEGI